MKSLAERILNLLSNRYHKYFLCAYWALTQLVIFLHEGIRTSVDSTVYIENALKPLVMLIDLNTHDFWYIGYTSLLGLILSVMGSLSGMIVVQIIFSGLALLALYRLVLHLSGDIRTAFVACFFCIFWFEIHTWNFFIYTESLFTSCSIISFYFLVTSKKPIQYFLTLIFILFTCLIRPVGISFLVSTFIYWLLTIELSSKVKGIISVSAILISVLLADKMLGSFELISSYTKAEIIYPNVKILIATPGSINVPESKSPVWQLFLFAAYNPLYFLKLCALKLILFFGHIKPYFSKIHNLFIVVVLYPIYGLAMKGLHSVPDRAVLAFLCSYVVFQGMTVMLTTENWDGRFLPPVLPFIFILAAFGCIQFLKNKSSAEN